MPDRIDESSRVLGGIERTLEMISRAQSDDRIAAAQYRTDIRKELAEMRDEMHGVSIDLRVATVDIATIKPTVEKLEQGRLMSAGAQKLAVVLGKGAHIISAAIGGLIFFLLNRWLPK